MKLSSNYNPYTGSLDICGSQEGELLYVRIFYKVLVE